jgi:hypothetical protein
MGTHQPDRRLSLATRRRTSEIASCVHFGANRFQLTLPLSVQFFTNGGVIPLKEVFARSLQTRLQSRCNCWSGLRSEPRHGSFYYEISHDRIAETIHHNRRSRMRRKLHWASGMVLHCLVPDRCHLHLPGLLHPREDFPLITRQRRRTAAGHLVLVTSGSQPGARI